MFRPPPRAPSVYLQDEYEHAEHVVHAPPSQPAQEGKKSVQWRGREKEEKLYEVESAEYSLPPSPHPEPPGPSSLCTHFLPPCFAVPPPLRMRQVTSSPPASAHTPPHNMHILRYNSVPTGMAVIGPDGNVVWVQEPSFMGAHPAEIAARGGGGTLLSLSADPSSAAPSSPGWAHDRALYLPKSFAHGKKQVDPSAPLRPRIALSPWPCACLIGLALRVQWCAAGRTRDCMHAECRRCVTDGVGTAQIPGLAHGNSPSPPRSLPQPPNVAASRPVDVAPEQSEPSIYPPYKPPMRVLGGRITATQETEIAISSTPRLPCPCLPARSCASSCMHVSVQRQHVVS